MSINQRQYQQLTEMGISLWQHKTTAYEDTRASKNNSEHKISYLAHNDESLTALTQQTFFTDFLLTLNLSIGEISAQEDHLDLGLFNWFFHTSKNKILSINYANSKLTSPSIEIISKSPALKRQLWQIISTNLL
jgi:DNA polymerase III psi subunit